LIKGESVRMKRRRKKKKENLESSDKDIGKKFLEVGRDLRTPPTL
jgi:hypothetical protein